jgi:gliding motility-associated-like protein
MRASQYEWIFDDGATSTEFEPRHIYTTEGKYMVTLVAGFDNGNYDIDGDDVNDGNVICYDTTKQELVALDGGYMKLPNAFTPSQHGSSGGVPGSGTFNDVFLPIMRGVQEFQMQIFDRWGTLLFESKDRNIGWDGYDRHGRALPAGVYVYKLVLRLSDGQRTTKIGDVTLIK